MIRLEGLTMWYDETRALDGVDLHVGEGECFGFIGPNGAGKTTTIRILATLQQASGGRAFVGGVDVSRHPEEVRRLIGYMPDFFGIYDDLKAWEYLDFYAAAHAIPYRRRRELVRDVLDLVDLSSKADAQVSGLSRGMQQRLCLAKTLVHEPRVLLLDEPASGLDPRARIEMRALLGELRAMGKTIFISSHILSELGELCTQVGILEKGQLLADGRPDELARRLKPHFELHVKVAGDAERARVLLEGREKIVSVALRDGALRATFEGPREEIPAVLKGLVDEGCAVFEFRVEAMDLEEIFLQVTRGEVQ